MNDTPLANRQQVDKVVNSHRSLVVCRILLNNPQVPHRIWADLITQVTIIDPNGGSAEGLLIVKADSLLLVHSARSTCQLRVSSDRPNGSADGQKRH